MGRAFGALTRRLALAVVALCVVAQAALAVCAPDRLIVDTGRARQEFTIELADTDATRGKGLMNRPHLPSAAGMLFAYPAPQRAQFWMANTLIPLDMIFAGPDGVILGVNENAVPLDRSVIDGGDGVQFVLEINGGLARRMGIAAGGALHHPIIPGSECAP